MRALSYILIVVGFWMLSLACYQEYRGVTDNPGRRSVGKISKENNPDGFRNAMTYRWLRAVLILGAGGGLLYIVRRQDRLDPLSPDFEYKDDTKA